MTICISGWLSLFGQINTITIKFQEHSENTEIAGLLKALDASQVTATLCADSLDATYYEIWMVECSGSENKRTKIGYKVIEPDSTKITFTAVPKDSTNVAFSFMRLSSGVPRMTLHKFYMCLRADEEKNLKSVRVT